MPFCKTYFKLRERRATPHVPSDARPWAVPDLCRAYDWPTGLAGGGVIAIVELGGGWIQSDMDAFFRSVGQPIPQITDVETVDGTKNTPNHDSIDDPAHPNPDVEVALDIQVAAAAYYVATGKPATIRVYWAQDIAPAVQKATADGCDVCSISWGSDEATWKQFPGTAEAMESAALAATNAGMVVFAATGDNDSSDGGPTPANVDLPSTCPHVVACGGTTKTANSETVWNDDPGNSNGNGTGGGYSTVSPPQSFQIGAPAGPGRMVPDVAANADPYTGYIILVHGQTIPMGGTSAVAPFYAGLFASFGTKLGFVTPTLWANQVCFNDITEGDNGMFRAQVGPDPCTGIGSPIGTKIATLITSSPHSLEPHAVPPGWSGTIAHTYFKGKPRSTSVTLATSEGGSAADAGIIQDAYGDNLKSLFGTYFNASITDPGEAAERFAKGVKVLRDARAQAIELVKQ
jgi:kumamolisin